MITRKKLIIIGLIITTLTVTTRGLFGLFKKPQQALENNSNDPYKEKATNLIYNLPFCDNLDLYKENTQPPYTYPFVGCKARIAKLIGI